MANLSPDVAVEILEIDGADAASVVELLTKHPIAECRVYGLSKESLYATLRQHAFG